MSDKLREDELELNKLDEISTATLRNAAVKVSGMCQGCEKYHAGDLIIKIVTVDSVPVLLIGTEGEGNDGEFHVLSHPMINQIPGSSLLQMFHLPGNIQ